MINEIMIVGGVGVVGGLIYGLAMLNEKINNNKLANRNTEKYVDMQVRNIREIDLVHYSNVSDRKIEELKTEMNVMKSILEVNGFAIDKLIDIEKKKELKFYKDTKIKRKVGRPKIKRNGNFQWTDDRLKVYEVFEKYKGNVNAKMIKSKCKKFSAIYIRNTIAYLVKHKMIKKVSLGLYKINAKKTWKK